ncbi:14561_t:CDS:2, partial [Dentiscutata heterogama]
KHGGGSERSEMWLYFTKVIWTKEKKTAQCKNCNHEPFSCGVNGTTKPLWQHLESAHWAKYVLKNLLISASISTEVDNIKLCNMFARWIIYRQRPFSLIEDPELTEI